MSSRLRHILATLFPRPAAKAAQPTPAPPPPPQPRAPTLPDPPALAGLDDIDWPSLHHAHGPATDVPDLLRALVSSDEEARRAASYDLYGTIWHQGTVYGASPHAVPFLIRLLAAPISADRPDLLALLDALANGTSYHAVHYPDGRSFDGKPVPNYSSRRADEERAVAATRDAVAAGFDLYATLLTDPDWRVRAGSANLLASFADRADAIPALFHRAADAEGHALARCALWLSFAKLADASHRTIDRLTGVLAHATDVRERYAAASSLVRLGGESATEDAVHLVAAFARDEWISDAIFHGLSWNWNWMEGINPFLGTDDQVLAKVPADRAPAEPIATYVAPLAVTVDEDEAPGLAAALVFVAFPNAQSLTGSPWNDRQRRAVRAIVDADVLWRDPNRMAFLHGRGLGPGKFGTAQIATYRDDLRRLLEQNEKH